MASGAPETQDYPIANLIQGVSQQSARQRRDTQCEEQFDCINSPVDGCVARPPIVFRKMLTTENRRGAFVHELFRGSEEHYLVVVHGGDLKVYDAETGTEVSLTVDTPLSYLDVTGDPRDHLVAATLEDYTFVANKQVKPAIDGATLAPAARNEAILYFRAGNYLTTFQVAITYNGHVYTYTYKTPDNTVAANAEYITTNQLAATFYRAMSGSAATVTTNGATATANNANVGPVAAGQTTGVTGGTTLTSLGFTVRLFGNIVLISRADSSAFKIDAADGNGNAFMKAIKGQAQSFSDLPANCFEGVTLKVKGDSNSADDDYWVTFKGGDGSAGYWEECPAPATPLGFDPETMPHVLVNTNVNEFHWGYSTFWGQRVSGDGVDSAKDPGFVGKAIEDIFYDHTRLAILTEGTCDWSKTRNPFVFFPSSAQTVLATDPISNQIAGGKSIALLRKAVQTDESTFLWAQKKQFRVTSGQDPFKQDTVEAPPSSSFEFSQRSTPLPLGTSLYFASDQKFWSTVRDVLIRDGKVAALPLDVTAHVKRYIPAGIRYIVGSDAQGFLALTCDNAPNLLFVYNFLLSDTERLQSAWNVWRFPEHTEIVWAGLSDVDLLLLLQRPDGLMLATIDITTQQVDLEVEGAEYLTRMDFKVPSTLCTKTYDAPTNRSTIVLPYEMPEATSDTNKALVVTGGDGPKSVRGQQWRVRSVVGKTIIVDGDITGEAFYVGLRISAERLESEFHLRSSQGPTPVDRLQVSEFALTYADTGYTRIEVSTDDTDVRSYEMSGRTLGDPNNVTGRMALASGTLKAPVMQTNLKARIRIVNDSFLPSYWSTASYGYQPVFRKRPAQQASARS